MGRRRRKMKASKTTIGELTLLAYLALRRPRERRLARLIPKDGEAWLDFLLNFVKKKQDFPNLSDKDIRKTIILARPNIGRKKPENRVADPDLPDCHAWTIEQVGEWLEFEGHANLKEAFKKNGICGRKLVTVDASALNKMGVRYFSEIKEVAGKIRELLDDHRPNMMRALMRRVPYHEYLHERQHNGYVDNVTTFEKFCEARGFPYTLLMYNPCALISCTCQVLIQKAGTQFDEDIGASDSDNESEQSLAHAPSVEFTIRHILVRNRVVKDVIDELVGLVTTDLEKRKLEAEVTAAAKRMKEILEGGFEELGLSEDDLRDRIEFAKLVAEEMMEEVRRTQRVLQDIQEFKRSLRDKSVSDVEVQNLRAISAEFVEAVAVIGALLALGEFDLESIFRQEPEFEEFVDGIVEEAELTLNDRVPSADVFVQDVLSEAKLRILALDFPDLPINDLRALKDYAEAIIDQMITDAILTVTERVMAAGTTNYAEDLLPEDWEFEGGGGQGSSLFQQGSELGTAADGGPQGSQLRKGGRGTDGPRGRNLGGQKKGKSALARSKSKATGNSSTAGEATMSSSSPAGGDTTEVEVGTSKSDTTGTKLGSGSGPTTTAFSAISSAGEGNAFSGPDGKGSGSKWMSSSGSGEQGTTAGRMEPLRSQDSERHRNKRSGLTQAKDENSSPSSDDKNIRTTSDQSADHRVRKMFGRASRTDINSGTVDDQRQAVRMDDNSRRVSRLHRTEFVEKWAHEVDPIGTGNNIQDAEETEKARLIRLTADQVVSDVVQKALRHMLLEAESGQDSYKIMNLLEQMKIEEASGSGQASVSYQYTRANNPYNIGAEIIRLWTPHVDSKSFADPETGGASGAPPRYRYPYQPPQGTQTRAHLYEPKRKGKREKKEGCKEESEQCKNADLVCFYPIIRNYPRT